jgi:hypothetical protein
MSDVQILLIFCACILAFAAYLVLCDRVRA